MIKKQYPKLKKPKVKDPVSEVPDHSDILAITEGHFGKPVARSGRFINVNNPPKDATKEELEAIERFWVSQLWKMGNGLKRCVIE